jgi:hypothetical protein
VVLIPEKHYFYTYILYIRLRRFGVRVIKLPKIKFMEVKVPKPNEKIHNTGLARRFMEFGEGRVNRLIGVLL